MECARLAHLQNPIGTTNTFMEIEPNYENAKPRNSGVDSDFPSKNGGN
jgi:hypothetical protein